MRLLGIARRRAPWRHSSCLFDHRGPSTQSYHHLNQIWLSWLLYLRRHIHHRIRPRAIPRNHLLSRDWSQTRPKFRSTWRCTDCSGCSGRLSRVVSACFLLNSTSQRGESFWWRIYFRRGDVEPYIRFRSHLGQFLRAIQNHWRTVRLKSRCRERCHCGLRPAYELL